MSYFNRLSSDIRRELVTERVSALVNKDPEWQRVNTYIADVLKDSHTLYAKITRLQSDFDGKELQALQMIAEGVLKMGDQLSIFAKNYYEGKLNSAQVSYGDTEAPSTPDAEAPPAPAPVAPSAE